jgi:hypothetical protein
LEGEQKFVFDMQLRGQFSAALVQFFEGFLKNFQHIVKDLSLDTEESFELPVAERQGFLDACGLNHHGSQKRAK